MNRERSYSTNFAEILAFNRSDFPQCWHEINLFLVFCYTSILYTLQNQMEYWYISRQIVYEFLEFIRADDNKDNKLVLSSS